MRRSSDHRSPSLAARAALCLLLMLGLGAAAAPTTVAASGDFGLRGGMYPYESNPPVCGELLVTRASDPGEVDTGEVTVTDDTEVSAIQNFTVTNGTYTIAPLSPGDTSVLITAFKTDQSMLTTFSFDALDYFGNWIHCT